MPAAAILAALAWALRAAVAWLIGHYVLMPIVRFVVVLSIAVLLVEWYLQPHHVEAVRNAAMALPASVRWGLGFIRLDTGLTFLGGALVARFFIRTVRAAL